MNRGGVISQSPHLRDPGAPQRVGFYHSGGSVAGIPGMLTIETFSLPPTENLKRLNH